MHNINEKHVNETTDLLVRNYNSRTYMVFISENRFNVGYKIFQRKNEFFKVYLGQYKIKMDVEWD